MKSIIDKIFDKIRGNRPAVIRLKPRNNERSGYLSPVPVRIKNR